MQSSIFIAILCLFSFALSTDFSDGIYRIISKEDTILTGTNIRHPNKRGFEINAVQTKMLEKDNKKQIWKIQQIEVDPNADYEYDDFQYEIGVNGPNYDRTDMHVVMPYPTGYALMERWSFTEKKNGFYQLRGYNKRCLQNNGIAMNITKVKCNGEQNQLWKFQKA